MTPEPTKYTAWIWRGEGPTGERKESQHDTAKEAKAWLALRIAEWPEAEEYGFDHEEPDGPVTDFLSYAIKRRMRAGSATQ